MSVECTVHLGTVLHSNHNRALLTSNVQAMSGEQARDAAAAAEQQREALEQRLDMMAAYVDAARAAAVAAGGAGDVQPSAHSGDPEVAGNSGLTAARAALPARPAARALAQQFAEVAQEVDTQVPLPPPPPLSSPGLLGALSEAAARVMGAPLIQISAGGAGLDAFLVHYLKGLHRCIEGTAAGLMYCQSCTLVVCWKLRCTPAKRPQ